MSSNNISFSAFKVFWGVVLTIGVFAGTLYTTQSVSNTRINFLEQEIASLKSDITIIVGKIDDVENNQSIALADISQKLHQMELQLKELQVTLFILVDETRKEETEFTSTSTIKNISPSTIKSTSPDSE